MKTGANLTMDQQVAILREILKRNEVVYEFIKAANRFSLPNWYVGAGCITQTVWNYLSGFPLTLGIKDIDLVYFASNLSAETENAIAANIRKEFAQCPLDLDIKNEARVHLWYKDYFGYEIQPYLSCEDAINTWPTTATSVGICLTDEFRVFAPFGLNDLFKMIARANKAQITEKIYLDKVERWKKHWPSLTVVPWKE